MSTSRILTARGASGLSGLLTLAVALVLAACGSDDALITVPEEEQTEPVPRYVYASNSDLGAVNAWAIDVETGELDELTGSPFGSIGTSLDLETHPSGPWLYVGSVTTDSVHIFEVDPDTGEIAEIAGSPVGGGMTNLNSIAVSPDGEWLFATDENGSGTVRSFTIDPDDGGLTPAGTPAATVGDPYCIDVHPTSEYVYVCNNLGSSVGAWSLNSANGNLTPLPGQPYDLDSGDPWDVSPHPSGEYLYVADTVEQGVFRVELNGNGTLGSYNLVGDGGSGTRHAQVDPSGEFLYSGRDNGNVAGYTIGSNGQLTPTTPATYPAATFPSGLTVDLSGAFVLTANGNDDDVSVFAIDPDDGSLSEAAGSPYAAGGTMRDVAVWAEHVPVSEAE